MSVGRCPNGGPRCPRSICDCFIDQCAACAAGRCPQRGIHPEFFIVGAPQPASPDGSGGPE